MQNISIFAVGSKKK